MAKRVLDAVSPMPTRICQPAKYGMPYVNRTHITDLSRFFGQHFSHCSDAIDETSCKHNLQAAPIDLDTDPKNINIEDDRLNVGLRGGVVWSFWIG